MLGGVLIDESAMARVVDVVDDSMFYREAHRRMFRAMTRLFERGKVIDPITVSEDLKAGRARPRSRPTGARFASASAGWSVRSTGSSAPAACIAPRASASLIP